MEALLEMAGLQGTLLILLCVGIFMKKKHIITEEGMGSLTGLLINIILPCNIIKSFLIDFSFSILRQCLTVLVIAVLIQVLCVALSNTLYRRTPASHRAVLQYATVCSNAGFMGNPIAETLFGSMGLLYASIYLIPLRIVMWSAGISYFTQESNLKKALRRVVIHPCVIAVYIGIPLMLSGVTLPAFLENSISSIGGCCTAISMITIGGILADGTPDHLLNKEMIAYALLRLLLIPGIVLLGCLLFSIDELAAGVSVVLAGMPAGSTTAILASQYGGDAKFASNCVVFTTVLSFFTIPVIYTLLRFLYG